MKQRSYNLAVKVLLAILLLCLASSFLLSRFITETNFMILTVSAAVVAAVSERSKYTLAAILGILVVTLEFLKILPLPYNYLFSHGVPMGPAIILTLSAAAIYVAIPIWLVLFWCSRQNGKNCEPKNLP